MGIGLIIVSIISFDVIASIASIIAFLSTAYILLTALHIRHVPISISSMAYAWEEDDSDTSQQLTISNVIWMFYIWMCGVLVGPALIDLLPESVQVLGFLTMASLLFLGCMPLLYKDDHNVWHWVFGIASCVLSQICILIICPVVLCIWAVMPLVYIVRKLLSQKWRDVLIPDLTMYVEVICGIVVLAGLVYMGDRLNAF